MKKDYTKNKSVTIKLENIQQRINETRFEGLDLKDIIEKYFEIKIITNKKIKQNEKEEFEEFLEEQTKGEIKYSENIKKVLEQEKIWIRKLYNENKENANKVIKDVIKVVENLPKSKQRLPVIASSVLNNPHALDRGTIQSNLLNKILCNIMENNTYEGQLLTMPEIYFKFNILIDDVSNMVLCKNILAKKDKVLHAGIKGFFDNNEALQITLDNLSNIDEVELEYEYCVVVENPAVFMELANKIGNDKIPLVCTYGQLKLSAIVLLKMIEQKVKTIYYSGDIDPEGLQIATGVKRKLGAKVTFVGLDESTYMKNKSNVILTELRLAKLNKVHSEFNELVKLILLEKKAAYEEANIEEIYKCIKLGHE